MGQVGCWLGGGIAPGLGLWLPQAALALGQRLSKTGSAQRRAPELVGFGAGIKGGLFPAVGSCLPGQAVQGMGSLSFGRRSGILRKSRLFFHLAPQAGVVCSGVAATGQTRPVELRRLLLTGQGEGCAVVSDAVLGSGSQLTAQAEPEAVPEKFGA